jgi:putative transposase
MERKANFSVNEFYHVYSRGNNKTAIFLDVSDQNRFQKLLFFCNSKQPLVFKTIQGLTLDEGKRGETLVDIGAYCLMPNHFHLLLREKSEGGISLFMKKLLTAYSMYFNKKYERTGKLFEGAFMAQHADHDRYLKYLFSYIHLNPVKVVCPKWKENGYMDLVQIKQYLKNFYYSSYLDYLGISRLENKILQRSSFPDYFSGNKDFEYFINEWLTFPRSHLGGLSTPISEEELV